MSKNNIVKGIWVCLCIDTDINEEIKFVVVASSQSDCKDVISTETEKKLKFDSIVKIGNIAPKLIEQSNITWEGESMIVLSNLTY